MNRDQAHLERSTSVRSGPALPPEYSENGKASSTKGRDRPDALWAEMQATLEEVELSATGGTHVFGPEHDRKLTELRRAQIELAQAWARSEADGSIGTISRDRENPSSIKEARNDRGPKTEQTKAAADDNGTDHAQLATKPFKGELGGETGGADASQSSLREETEMDIVLARKRREANDKYFQRVNNGVIDVVSKLEGVAVAMRAVEQESNDVWNESSFHSD